MKIAKPYRTYAEERKTARARTFRRKRRQALAALKGPATTQGVYLRPGTKVRTARKALRTERINLQRWEGRRS